MEDKPDNAVLYIDLNKNFSILMKRLKQLEVRVKLLEKQMKELENKEVKYADQRVQDNLKNMTKNIETSLEWLEDISDNINYARIYDSTVHKPSAPDVKFQVPAICIGTSLGINSFSDIPNYDELGGCKFVSSYFILAAPHFSFTEQHLKEMLRLLKKYKKDKLKDGI
jgi:hypothetical protein